MAFPTSAVVFLECWHSTFPNLIGNWILQDVCRMLPFARYPCYILVKRSSLAGLNMHGIKTFCSCTPTGKDVPKMLAINTVDTRRILKGYASSELKRIVQEIAAGYQLETQKAKWAADADCLCQYCSQPDSRYHRMYVCFTADDVRAPFQDTLDFFQENETDIHDFPFLLQHPNAELVGILHQQQPEAEVEHSTL